MIVELKGAVNNTMLQPNCVGKRNQLTCLLPFGGTCTRLHSVTLKEDCGVIAD